MGFKAGIVGLPNVGKSTLFTALSREQALIANYPFATIEPNLARVPVPDERLEVIARISQSNSIVPATLDLVDIAGLVRGASRGEGLGNQFLSHIRGVDAIIEVVRAFRNPDVMHVEGEIEPGRDLELIETELLLSDLEYLERRLKKLRHDTKRGDPGIAQELKLAEETLALLGGGATFHGDLPSELLHFARSSGLLSFKPLLIVVNIGEEDLSRADPVPEAVRVYAQRRGVEVIPLCARVEAELSALSPGEQEAFLNEYGIKERGLRRVIRSGYHLLDLITFFTTESKEARAWTIPRGTRAPQAARRIHSDFERGFIRAEVVSYEDFVELKGWSRARAFGKVRSEGKEYEVQDGDVILFRFAV